MNTREAWNAIAIHYQKLARQRAGEGPGIQLACLVIADYCSALWAGQRGPSLAMIALAEHILGTQIDEVVAAALIKVDAAHRENAS